MNIPGTPEGVVGESVVGPVSHSQGGRGIVELFADETNCSDIGLKVIGYMSKDMTQKLGRDVCNARHDCVIEMVSSVSDPKGQKNLVTLCWLRLALRLPCLCSLNLRQFFWQSGDSKAVLVAFWRVVGDGEGGKMSG
jgi:hypothetical protein